MLFSEQDHIVFSKQLSFPVNNPERECFWLCSVRINMYGYVMDVCGETQEEAESNADFIIERLNSQIDNA